MLKCIIVEDEVLAQQVIQNHLGRVSSLELVAVCSNVTEARSVLEKQAVDVMFLDIELPGMTGLNFLRELTISPIVVLTTAYSGYALESYELNVADYLLKPISFERFSKALQKVSQLDMVRKQMETDKEHIFIKSNGKFFRINYSSIRYIEGLRDYLKIHTDDSTLVTHQTMNEMERMLPSKQFIRVHKSYLVAISRIRSIYGNTIETDRIALPIGVNYKERVMGLVGRK